MKIKVICIAVLVLCSQSFMIFGGKNSDDLLRDYNPDLKTVSIEDPYFQQFNKVHPYSKAHYTMPTKFTFVAKYPSITYTSIDGDYLLDMTKILNGYPVYINIAHSKFIGMDSTGSYTVSELVQLPSYLNQAASGQSVSLNGTYFGSNDPIQRSQWMNYAVFTPLYCPLILKTFQLKYTGTQNNGKNEGTYTLDPNNIINNNPVYVNSQKQRFIAVDTGVGAWTIVGTQYLAAIVSLSAKQNYSFSGFYSGTNGVVPIQQSTWAQYQVIPKYQCL